MAKKINEDEFIKLAMERFDEADTAENENRENALIDMKMENGDMGAGYGQWTEEEVAERPGRPCHTDNRLAGAVKQITGDALLNRPSIKVRPSDSVADPLTAEILTGLIRNIENNSDAEDAYDTGHGCSVRGAVGYWRVKTDYADDDVFEQEIFIERIVNPQSVYYDQGGIKKTYEDAEYCFIIDEMRKSRFIKEYPKAKITDFSTSGTGTDKSGWFAKETARVAEYWYKEPYDKHIFQLIDGQVIEIKNPVLSDYPDEGHQPVMIVQDGDAGTPMQYRRHRVVKCKKIMQAIISGSEILRKPREWPGKFIPIVPCLGEEIWIDGERILRSAIRHAIEPQKIHNWNVSNDMETKALAPRQPWIVALEQIEGYEKYWDTANTTPYPYLPYKHVPGLPAPQRLSGSTSDAGAVNGMMMSVDAIKAATGVFDASLGNRSNETSGVAIQSRQRQTSASTYVFIDNQTKAMKYTGRILIDLIPKIYDTERIVRLIGPDLKKKFQKQQPGPDGRPTINVAEDGMTALARINFKDPLTNKIYNDITIGKYDAVVDAGPGYMTRRQEAADGMIQLSQAAPQFMPVMIPRIARNLDWPDADEIGDEIKQMTMPAQPPPPNPKDMAAIEKGKQDIQKGQQDLQKGVLDLKMKNLDIVGKTQDIMANRSNDDQRMAVIAQSVVMNILKQLGF